MELVEAENGMFNRTTVGNYGRLEFRQRKVERNDVARQYTFAGFKNAFRREVVQSAQLICLTPQAPGRSPQLVRAIRQLVIPRKVTGRGTA